ncbi:glycosyltransferase [Acinetobacter sp.]|uniref:glycosyltransferase n=1 Tax=Acinetobacter sp. TaxID=472 RepID=UPI003B00DD0E
MKILLIGEYSGVHTTIAKKLKESEEYDINIIHDGDGYKNFKPDILIKTEGKVFNNRVLRKFYALYKLLLNFFGLTGAFKILKYRKELRKLKNYDVVQLINPIFLSGFGAWINLIIFFYLRKNNKKIVLLAVGDDTAWVKACLYKKIEYSFFDRMNVKNILKFLPTLFHLYSPAYYLLNKYVVRNSDVIVAGVYDYYLAYYGEYDNLVYIPLSIEINSDIVPFKFNGYPIKIFHGWQLGRDFKKGNDIFDRAILKLKDNFLDKIDYQIVSNVSYNEYIKLFNDSIIFIDQCYSMDKGINALLGMAHAKVVLSGNDDVLEKYDSNVKKSLINALPDENEIYAELEKLIKNPKLLEYYSENAYDYVNKNHNISHNIVKFIEVWRA